MSPTASPLVETGQSIAGNVHGAQQPVSGAHVYLMQANTGNGTGAFAGNGVPASTANASISTLTPNSVIQAPSGGGTDSVGSYVLTSASGGFTISGDYTCTANTQLYLYVLGGNTGGGASNNPAAGFLAALGNCPSNGSFATLVPFVQVNEVTTVAAAYAIAGYATDATHVASSGSTIALTGIANAFLSAPNLINVASGVALTTTPAGNGTVPQGMINTIANILAACVNSSNSAASPASLCTTLFANAKSAGSTGTTPTDTATAAINIAHNPSANVSTLFGLASGSPAFAPALGTAPNDFLLGINYSGQGTVAGGLNGAYAIAIDAAGDAWFTNVNNSSVSKLSSTGSPQSPTNGFTTGSQGLPLGIAIDLNEDAWVADFTFNNLTEYSRNGTVVSPAGGFTGGGINKPQDVKITGNGVVLVANFNSTAGTGTGSVSAFTSSTSNTNGQPISGPGGYTGGATNTLTSIAVDNQGEAWVSDQMPAPGGLSKLNVGTGTYYSNTQFTGGGLSNPQGLAIDSNSSVWAADRDANLISNFSSSGTAVSTTGYSGGGLNGPIAIAIDGASNIWVANQVGSTVSEFTNGGTPLSPSTGLAVGGVSKPQSIEIDGSGNVWIANNPPANSTINAVTELIGAAVPRITPLSIAISQGKLGQRP